MMMNNGREGDWECSGCRNRNYAFRSFCNRCKQPRLLVDIKTPADSKWLPRIGDWICIGCSNNNYASREKCKKCGQSREEAAMPAMAMLGARMNYGTPDTCFLRPNSSTPPVAGWPFSGIIDAHHHANSACNVIGVPKGWREGDWMCICGFHNYASRAQCKKCNAPSSAVSDVFRGPGIKRVASEEFVHEMDSKRRNGGDKGTHLLMMMPGILGKGAKQWRDGDWMCSNCSNHNFANRSFCNRCKTERGAAPQPVSVI